MDSKLTQIRVSPPWHRKFGLNNITQYPFYIARMELAMSDPGRNLMIIGFFILVAALAPFFLIALGLGWALREMAAVRHKLTFSPWSPTAP